MEHGAVLVGQNAEHVRPNIFICICLGSVDPGLA